LYLTHEILDSFGKPLAVLLTPNETPMPVGTKFLTPESSQQQVGVIKRLKGSVVPPHTHIKQERSVSETAEVLVVQSGEIQVRIYQTDNGPEDRYRGMLVAGEGSIVVLMRGGHSVQFVEDSQLLEVKTGPYKGRANDKKDINVKE